MAEILDSCSILCAPGKSRLQPDVTGAVGAAFINLSTSLDLKKRDVAPRDRLPVDAVQDLLRGIGPLPADAARMAERTEALGSRYEPGLSCLTDYLMLPLPPLVAAQR